MLNRKYIPYLKWLSILALSVTIVYIVMHMLDVYTQMNGFIITLVILIFYPTPPRNIYDKD
jgi:hypothetical protein